MAIPNTSEKSVALDREENITKGQVSAKKVALYTYDSDTDTLIPYTSSASGGLTDAELRATPVPVSGTVTVDDTDDTTATGTIVANGGTVVAAVTPGMKGWVMAYQGTYSTGASLTMEVSFDSGATYKTCRMLAGTTSTLGYVLTIAAGANGSSYYTADIPAGATHLRVRCSAWAAPTGTINIIIGQSPDRNITPAGAIVLTSGTVTTLTNITNWGNIVDNAAFTDGTTRLMPGGYIYDEVAGTALTENDAAAARIDSKRAQVFTLEDATTRGRRTEVTAANALKVDGSAVTQPISATNLDIRDLTNADVVTAELSATDNAVLDAIEADTTTLAAAVSGSEMQVDVVGALPAGTNAIGKLAANSGVDIGDVDVTSSVATSFATGSNLDVDTTAEQLVPTSVAAKFGVLVKAAATNTGTLYVGASSSVTAGTTAATDGFPLEPGESVTIAVNNINLLYGIASAADQKVFLMVV